MKSDPISLMLFSNMTVRAGVEEHVLQLLAGLDRKYFRPHLVCTPELAELAKNDIPADVPVLTLHLDRFGDISGAGQFLGALRKWKIQLLHSHMFRASFFASPLGWLARVPVVVETAHVREVWRKSWKANYAIDRFASRFVDRTIAVSGAIARYLVEEKGISAGKITVIPPAPVLRRLPSEGLSREQRKLALGFQPSDLLLVLAGRLEPQKGHKVLIEAMPAVLREFPNARLVFLGSGSLREPLEHLVEEKGLGGCIQFAGYQTEVLRWFAAADLSILPSFFEGLPMTVLESLAAGCPVVATAVDGTPEVVLDGKTGLLVPPGDPGQLSQAVISMLRDREGALRMAQAGHEYVTSNFSVEKLIERTQAVYLEAWEAYLRRSKRYQSGEEPFAATSLANGAGSAPDRGSVAARE